jgi:hypothetical protein
MDIKNGNVVQEGFTKNIADGQKRENSGSRMQPTIAEPIPTMFRKLQPLAQTSPGLAP